VADNVTIDDAAGTDTPVAADDVSGVWYQRVKLTDATADSTKPLGVQDDAAHASEDAGMPVLLVRRDTPSASEVTADGDYVTAIADARGQQRIAGTYAEDAAHASGDLGVQMLTVRSDSAAALAGTTGDYQPLITDNTGRLWVIVAALPASTNTLEVVGDVAHDAVVAGNPVLQGGYAAGNPTAQSAVSASGDAVRLAADLNGNQWAHVDHRTTRIAVTVTTGTSIYASGDAVGAELTFAGVTRYTGGGGMIVGALIVDAGDTLDVDLELALFSATVSEAADNAAAAFSDAEALTLQALIEFPVAEARDLGGNRIIHVSGLSIPYVAAATSLFGQLIARGALAAPATTTSYSVVLWVLPD
jgi:hypothetical protein